MVLEIKSGQYAVFYEIYFTIYSKQLDLFCEHLSAVNYCPKELQLKDCDRFR